jgi:alpha-amylase
MSNPASGISLLSTIFQPRNDTFIAVNTPYAPSTALIKYVPLYSLIVSIVNTLYSVLTCRQWVVGAKGKIEAEYTLGGVPNILIAPNKLNGSGLCGTQKTNAANTSATSVKSSSSLALSSWESFATSIVLSGFLGLLALTH